MENITIRPYKKSDAAACTALYMMSLRENEEGFVQDIAFHGPFDKQMIEILNEGGFVLVAVDEGAGAVVGMGALILKQSLHRPVVWELGKLHVASTHQGQGIGRAIVEGLLKKLSAHRDNHVDLHVTTTQKAAIALYQKLGFVKGRTHIYDVNDGGKARAFETLFMHYRPSVERAA